MLLPVSCKIDLLTTSLRNHALKLELPEKHVSLGIKYYIQRYKFQATRSIVFFVLWCTNTQLSFKLQISACKQAKHIQKTTFGGGGWVRGPLASHMVAGCWACCTVQFILYQLIHSFIHSFKFLLYSSVNFQENSYAG